MYKAGDMLFSPMIKLYFFIFILHLSFGVIVDITEIAEHHDKHIVYIVPSPCTNCEKYDKIIASAAKEISVYKLNAVHNHILPTEDIPAIFIAQGSRYVLYKGEADEDQLADWYKRFDNDGLKFLSDVNFEHDTQAMSGGTTGNWLVVINDGQHDSNSKPLYEGLALQLKIQGTMVAVVDVAESPRIAKRFKVDKTPMIIFIRHGKFYRYDFDAKSYEKLFGFVTNYYTKAKSANVPPEPTQFDELLEYIVNQIRILEQKPGVKLALAVVLALMCCAGLVMFVTWFTCQQDKRGDRPKAKKTQ